MAFVPVPGVAKCEVLFHNDFFDGVNVLHIQGPDVEDPVALGDAAGAIAGAYQTTILPQKAGAFVLDAIRLTSLESEFGPQALSVSGESGGRTTATPMTPERSVLVRLITNLRGREHRGRIYDAGYADDQADVRGRLSSSSQAQVNQNWLDFRSALAALTPAITILVYSRKLATVNAITDAVASDVVGIQRRRIRP